MITGQLLFSVYCCNLAAWRTCTYKTFVYDGLIHEGCFLSLINFSVCQSATLQALRPGCSAVSGQRLDDWLPRGAATHSPFPKPLARVKDHFVLPLVCIVSLMITDRMGSVSIAECKALHTVKFKRSQCSRSSLIRVYTVYHFICIV